MSTLAVVLPEPTPTDVEVVATALETAGIFSAQGDLREALRWVRRAAELAGDAGDDERALGLARFAADVTAAATSQQESAPPPAPPPAAPEQTAVPVGPSTQLMGSAPPPPPPPPPVQAAPAAMPGAPQGSAHQAPLGSAPPPPPPPPPVVFAGGEAHAHSHLGATQVFASPSEAAPEDASVAVAPHQAAAPAIDGEPYVARESAPPARPSSPPADSAGVPIEPSRSVSVSAIVSLGGAVPAEVPPAAPVPEVYEPEPNLAMTLPLQVEAAPFAEAPPLPQTVRVPDPVPAPPTVQSALDDLFPALQPQLAAEPPRQAQTQAFVSPQPQPVAQAPAQPAAQFQVAPQPAAQQLPRQFQVPQPVAQRQPVAQPQPAAQAQRMAQAQAPVQPAGPAPVRPVAQPQAQPQQQAHPAAQLRPQPAAQPQLAAQAQHQPQQAVQTQARAQAQAQPLSQPQPQAQSAVQPQVPRASESLPRPQMRSAETLTAAFAAQAHKSNGSAAAAAAQGLRPESVPPTNGGQSERVTVVAPVDTSRFGALRQAVRASLQPTTEDGVYRLQILSNREQPPEGGYEALVVLVEPSADLFSD